VPAAQSAQETEIAASAAMTGIGVQPFKPVPAHDALRNVTLGRTQVRSC